MSEPLFLVYGSDCSYYTGKLEAYLRAKGIAYRLEPFGEANMRRAAQHTGVVQIPQVECPDGSWLVDTTLIIDHLERVQPEPAIRPRVPAVAFASLLLEDFADEWLWRPAMHYRWSFPANARLMSGWLAEHAAERRAPAWLKALYWRRRQLGTFVTGDGVAAATRAAVERTYLDTLTALEGIFVRRPYVLGARPTEADFGFFASMFRHFACDPVPGRLMRTHAPGVHEWVARLWNATPARTAECPLPERLPDDLGPLLFLVTGEYLPYLEANARAFAAGETRVRYTIRGTTFDEPTKPYRVWCRDRLQRALAALEPSERAAVERVMGGSGALNLLAVPSPQPAPALVDALPVPPATRRAPVDSWWRPMR
jgi:glutathione S-transferase